MEADLQEDDVNEQNGLYGPWRRSNRQCLRRVRHGGGGFDGRRGSRGDGY